MKAILALQVIGSDFEPAQVGVSTDPELIRQFVECQRADLRMRAERRPERLREQEQQVVWAREALLDTVLEMVADQQAAQPHAERQSEEVDGG